MACTCLWEMGSSVGKKEATSKKGILFEAETEILCVRISVRRHFRNY